VVENVRVKTPAPKDNSGSEQMWRELQWLQLSAH